MNAEQLMQKLDNLNACGGAKMWAVGKSWQEVYDTCHRGDWLLWLFKKSNGNNFKRELILAKAHCANTVRHLMKDERSINAIEKAILYGEGSIEIEELNAAYAADAAAAYDDARSNSRQTTADICRKYLPIEMFNL